MPWGPLGPKSPPQDNTPTLTMAIPTMFFSAITGKNSTPSRYTSAS
jgi:hypothetical protein